MTCDSLRKPDVLAVPDDGENAYIIDYTVVWDRGDPSRHFDDKERYYSRQEIVDRVKVLHPHIRNVLVRGCVVGA